MTIPDLESLDAMLDDACSTKLGDTILYTSSDCGEERYLKAYVNHRDGDRTFDSATVIEQDMSIQILATKLSGKPNSLDRIVLPKLPSHTFKPINVRRDESGNHWEFELKEVNA